MRKQNKTWFFPALILIGMVFVLLGCGKQNEPSSQGVGTPKKQSQKNGVVRAAYVPSGYYLPFLVAAHEQLFEKRGYALELQRFQDNSQMINLFVNGQLDVTAQSSFTMFPIEVAHPGLLKFVYGQYMNGYAFMVPTDSTVHSLQDLKGMTIGTWKSPTAVNLISILLKNAGLQFDEQARESADFKIQRFGATEWPAALENRVVPAVFGFDVPLARFVASGQYRYVERESLHDLLQGQKAFNGGAFIASQLIETDPPKANAIREGLLEAVEIIRNNPDRVAQIVAETLLPPNEPLERRIAIAKATHFDEFTPPNEALILSAEATLKLLIAHQIVPKQFDAKAIFWLPQDPNAQ